MNWRTYALVSVGILALSWLIRIGIGYPEVDSFHKGAVYLLDCCVFVPMVVEYLKNTKDVGAERVKNVIMTSAFFLGLIVFNAKFASTAVWPDMLFYLCSFGGYCFGLWRHDRNMRN